MLKLSGGSPAWSLLEAAKGRFVYVNLWTSRPADPFDLVVSDINMPHRDGFHLLNVIRNRWPNTPVILMTGLSTLEKKQESLKAGAAAFLAAGGGAGLLFGTRRLPSSGQNLASV